MGQRGRTLLCPYPGEGAIVEAARLEGRHWVGYASA
jgi:hypothetical protein